MKKLVIFLDFAVWALSRWVSFFCSSAQGVLSVQGIEGGLAQNDIARLYFCGTCIGVLYDRACIRANFNTVG
jgi:hypothetical protein